MTRRRWWLLAAAVALAWLLIAALLLLGAARDLRDGRDAARRAHDRLDAEAIASGRAVPDVRRARDEFRAAARSTGNPLLLPVRVLPVFGRQLRSVHSLSGAARDVSDAALDALTRSREILDDPRHGGPARVDELRALEEAISDAARRVRAVDDLGPRAGLLGPLADAREELAERLSDAQEALDDAAAGTTAGRRLLEGPRRYLVIAANNAEMRAGSGMWLSGGVLTTAGGRLELGDVVTLQPFADPPNGAVEIEDEDLRLLWDATWPHPSWDWRALMVSPRLPASAETGLAMWKAAGRDPVDGILVVDPVALAAVLRATGPVDIDGQRVSAGDVVPLLLNKQYESLTPSSDEAPGRKELLGRIAQAAFAALDKGEWEPTTLARELAVAVSGRHLMAWAADPVDQRGWVAAGLDGDLDADSLLVSVLNRGANKLDWFLQTSAELSTAPDAGDTEVTVRLRFRNTTPPGQPRYVTGPPRTGNWAPGTYLGVVAVDVPGWARKVRIDGVVRPPVQGRDGRAQVVTMELSLAPGEAREVVVRFRSPGRTGSLVVEPSARVPAVSWRHGARAWQDTKRRAANWDER